MPHPLYRTLAIAFIAAPLLLAAGCATHKSVSKTVVVQPMPVTAPQKPMHVRVEWVDLNHHEVVSRVDGYRHVLSDKPAAVSARGEPDGPKVGKTEDTASNTSDADAALPADAHRASPTDPAVNHEMPRRKATSDAELDAWRKFCAGQPVTKDEQTLMAATLIPPALNGNCKPGWHGEK